VIKYLIYSINVIYGVPERYLEADSDCDLADGSLVDGSPTGFNRPVSIGRLQSE
jgi:hypothetical protein